MSDTSDTQLLSPEDLHSDESWGGATEPNDESEQLVGVTLNDTYIVERVLGEGGMGRVYLARHTRIAQKRVAVKVLHPEFAANSQVRLRFQREAEAAAAISHPNVVAVLDIDRTPRGLPYLVCEYLEGIDLADHLKASGKLSAAAAVHLGRQLCKALAATHASNVIHRDLKPQNIFLVGDFSKGVPDRPYVKVLDFGLSRLTDSSENQLTKTGVIMGTPAYMPPEQARGQRVDHRADIYGVGVILYTALTGRPPFDEDTPQATVIAVMHSEPPRPRSLEPKIPPHLELVIERAMAREPAARFQDMAAFEQALAALEPEILQRPSESLAPPPPVQPAQSGRRAPRESDDDIRAARPRLLFFLFLAVALLICAAVSAIIGVEHATRHRFSELELRLVCLGIVGSSLTPALLWMSHVRRKVWDNSSRVLALLGQVRAAVTAGAVTYGLGMLALHLVDDFAVRIASNSGLQPLGATWPGWSLLLPAMALDAAIVFAWRRRLASSLRQGIWRAIAIWLITGFGLALCALLIGLGIWWRHRGG
jgi:serine/threonine-protein kinase